VTIPGNTLGKAATRLLAFGMAMLPRSESLAHDMLGIHVLGFAFSDVETGKVEVGVAVNCRTIFQQGSITEHRSPSKHHTVGNVE
jgi:hypothetical protein